MAYPQMYGAKTVEYRLDPNDSWRIDFEDIESKMDDSVRLLVVINPNNPTGNVATEEEIDKLVKLAQNKMAIADEIYDGPDFTGSLVSVASKSDNVPVIVLNGVSKVYFAPTEESDTWPGTTRTGSWIWSEMGSRDYLKQGCVHQLLPNMAISQVYETTQTGFILMR